MNYKIILYVVVLFAVMFSLSGINFDKFMKTNKIYEARLLVLLLGFSLTYLVTNFIIDFIG